MNNRKNTLSVSLNSLRNTLVGMAGVVAVVLSVSACDDPHHVGNELGEASSDVLKMTSYGFRVDSQAPLNSNQWVEPQDNPVRIVVDKPFRLRFELESQNALSGGKFFSLEYRRNAGNWKTLNAEDFPYPIKKSELHFKKATQSYVESNLNVIVGEEGAVSLQELDGEGFLRLQGDQESLLALGQHNTFWRPKEYEAVLRFSEGGQAGLVFAYQDTENFHRLAIEGAGPISVIERKAGQDHIIKTLDVEVKYDQWIDVALAFNDGNLTIEYEWDPIIEGSEWEVEIPSLSTLSDTGLYVAEQNSVDVQGIEISADAQSPLVSIVSSPAYEHGAATDDLLQGSKLAFTGGSGVSFAPRTTTWSGAPGQSEWEFPIVLRYFADGALNNLDGDRYDFRLVDEVGTPVESDLHPSVVVEVPEGHLGGTFVETPMRLGPWQAKDGKMYFLIEPSETDNMMMIVRSENGGKNWLEMDGENRPETGDLEGVSTTFDGENIHILHQTSDDVLYHVFKVSDEGDAGGWKIRDEVLASPSEPPVQVSDLVVRADGSVVGVYGDLHKIRYRIRSKEGQWSDATIVDADLERDLTGPVLVKGANDTVHLAYVGYDGTAWYRQIAQNGELSAAMAISDTLGTDVEDSGAILPLVYLPESEAVSIIYRQANGELWERRVSREVVSPAVQVSERRVVRNAADSEQVGADAVVFGDQISVLFIEDETGHLYHVKRSGDGPWTEPKLKIVGENILWVRGAVVDKANGKKVYGFVYDGGSNGGSGMNRYAEIGISVPNL